MLKFLKRWRYNHFLFLIPKDKDKFDEFASDILKTYDLEDTQENRDLIYSTTFRLEFKHSMVLPRFYFDTIHRLKVNDMIHEYVKVLKDKEKAKEKDNVTLSILKQSPEEENAT